MRSVSTEHPHRSQKVYDDIPPQEAGLPWSAARPRAGEVVVGPDVVGSGKDEVVPDQSAKSEIVLFGQPSPCTVARCR
jgi:hypothetical protein